jgi:hypothetical protein
VDTAEIIEGPFPHTPARVDVWQIGCIIYSMMRGLGEGGVSLGGHLINVEDVTKDTDDDRDYQIETTKISFQRISLNSLTSV